MKKTKQPLKRYIVRKYIMAKSAKEAFKKDRTHMPDDVWVDDEWKKENQKDLSSAIGFSVKTERDYW
jgi:hypothetical protein